MGEHDGCPGVPHECEHAKQCIADALDEMLTERVAAARAELAHCQPCTRMLEFQIEFKVAMARSCLVDAPAHLQLRISQALWRVDLGDVGVEDL